MAVAEAIRGAVFFTFSFMAACAAPLSDQTLSSRAHVPVGGNLGAPEPRITHGSVLSKPPSVANDKPLCPSGMAHVARQGEAFCIDRWEAFLELSAGGVNTPWPGNRAIDGDSRRFFALSAPGVKPQGYISGRQAAQACLNSGKRLCSEHEWRTACRGPANTRYPYGDARKPNRCNDRFKVLDRHPVVRLFDEVASRDTPRSEMWNLPWMNDPRLHQMPDSVAGSGEFPECTNDYGVYDMVGNLHEWLLDEKGSFAGGFFMDTYQNGEGCEYRTRAHSFDYHDYSTGFRCCSDSG